MCNSFQPIRTKLVAWDSWVRLSGSSGVLLFAYSVAITGVLAKEIVYDKVPLTHFAPAIAVYVVAALLILLGTLMVFTGRLLKTKRRGLHQYGTLATLLYRLIPTEVDQR